MLFKVTVGILLCFSSTHVCVEEWWNEAADRSCCNNHQGLLSCRSLGTGVCVCVWACMCVWHWSPCCPPAPHGARQENETQQFYLQGGHMKVCLGEQLCLQKPFPECNMRMCALYIWRGHTCVGKSVSERACVWTPVITPPIAFACAHSHRQESWARSASPR